MNPSSLTVRIEVRRLWLMKLAAYIEFFVGIATDRMIAWSVRFK